MREDVDRAIHVIGIFAPTKTLVSFPRMQLRAAMSLKGSILENYRFDVRDFTDSHLEDLRQACYTRKGNKDLQNKLSSAIEYQGMAKSKYINRVCIARERAFMKYRRQENFKLFGIPEWAYLKYEKAKTAGIDILKATIPSKVSVFNEDRMNWPEIVVPPESMTEPHLMACMPPECVRLTGWERLKRAFMPSIYMEDYNPRNPSHSYNIDALCISTIASGTVCGLAQGYLHAKKDLDAFKKDRSNLHASKYWAFRDREWVFMKSLGKHGLRWGWRIGFLFGTISVISQSMAIYKLQDRVHHYVIGTAIGGALYKWKLGLGGMLKTGLVASLIVGLPVGFIFATLGYNQRVIFYYTRVEPKIQGPLTENGMSPLQLLQSYEKRLAILNLLQMPVSDEINNPNFYRTFAGTE